MADDGDDIGCLGCGWGCSGCVILIILSWVLMFGVVIGGVHYGISLSRQGVVIDTGSTP